MLHLPRDNERDFTPFYIIALIPFHSIPCGYSNDAPAQIAISLVITRLGNNKHLKNIAVLPEFVIPRRDRGTQERRVRYCFIEEFCVASLVETAFLSFVHWVPRSRRGMTRLGEKLGDSPNVSNFEARRRNKTLNLKLFSQL